jgi:hypothetical protein
MGAFDFDIFRLASEMIFAHTQVQLIVFVEKVWQPQKARDLGVDGEEYRAEMEITGGVR